MLQLPPRGATNISVSRLQNPEVNSFSLTWINAIAGSFIPPGPEGWRRRTPKSRNGARKRASSTLVSLLPNRSTLRSGEDAQESGISILFYWTAKDIKRQTWNQVGYFKLQQFQLGSRPLHLEIDRSSLRRTRHQNEQSYMHLAKPLWTNAPSYSLKKYSCAM